MREGREGREVYEGGEVYVWGKRNETMAHGTRTLTFGPVCIRIGQPWAVLTAGLPPGPGLVA